MACRSLERGESARQQLEEEMRSVLFLLYSQKFDSHRALVLCSRFVFLIAILLF